MTRFKTTLFVAAAAFGATGALAQTAPGSTPPASGAAPSTAAPAATAAAPASYTDADVDTFATAALEVQKIQQDSSIADADKQTKMSAAVTSSGLTPEKFNAMATASQSDPALMKRIQTAAAAKMKASGGAIGASGSANAAGSTGSTGMASASAAAGANTR